MLFHSNIHKSNLALTYFNSGQNKSTVVEVEKDVLGVGGGLLRDLSKVGLQKFQSCNIKNKD